MAPYAFGLQRIARVVCALLAGTFLARGATAEPAEVILQETRYIAIAPGLDYSHLVLTNKPWSIHIARLDRTHREFEIITTLGKGTIHDLSVLSAQTESVSPALGLPLAAVNGDFFAIKPGPYQGDPEGLQIIGGEMVSAPGSVCFWADREGSLHIDLISAELQVIWPDGATTPMGLNGPAKPNSATLFTPVFGTSTPTGHDAELVLDQAGKHPWLPLQVNRIYTARVREIRNSGSTPLGPGVAVLALNGRATQSLSSVKTGTTLQLSTRLSEDLGKAHTAIGGGPWLLKGGKENEWLTKGGRTNSPPRHPRTALGFNERNLFLVVVDGRQKDLSVGMTLAELADCLKDLGCTEAMNLDGGGSSTFWLNGKVLNSPSDKRERSLANALLIIKRAK